MQPLDPQWFVRTRSIYWHDRIPVMSQQNDHAVFFWGIGLMQQIVCPGTDTKAEPHSKFLRRYTQRFAFFSFAQCFIFIYLECASVKVCKLVIGRAMKVGRDIRPFPLSCLRWFCCNGTWQTWRKERIPARIKHGIWQLQRKYLGKDILTQGHTPHTAGQ